MSRNAIVSVFDKTGLDEFARELIGLGFTILSTGGTAKHLSGIGVSIRSIDDYTGHPEILEGRVKTLHPKIHGGILARTERADDLEQLTKNGIEPIEIVAVNLYPFTHKIAEVEAGRLPADQSLVESIDIGGPTMIRAAAKNYRSVVPVCDPADYPVVIAELREKGSVSLETRLRLAGKVFATMAAYDAAVARYFSLSEKVIDERSQPKTLAPVESFVLERITSLRYGENPHQQAGLYRPVQVGEALRGSPAETLPWQVQQGKELSYNNLLDMYAALDLFLELHGAYTPQHTAVIIKHNNPCGAAVAPSAQEAYVMARACDPVSAFGGIVVVSGNVDDVLAKTIIEEFVEVVVCESLTPAASEIFAKKKNLRLITCDFKWYMDRRERGYLSVRNFYGEVLLQTADTATAVPRLDRVVTSQLPTNEMLADLEFAWRICKHVKSNTIVVAKARQAIGIGAGQMSRVDAARLAIDRAKYHGHSVRKAVAASDAFLPFPDTLEQLNEAGIVALVQPGGSIKDEDVIAAANGRGMVMIFTGERHFRH